MLDIDNPDALLLILHPIPEQGHLFEDRENRLAVGPIVVFPAEVATVEDLPYPVEDQQVVLQRVVDLLEI
jgi:hypothetical protein